MNDTHAQTANKQVGDVTLTVGDDPTNTAHIREGFIREVQRRFREFRGLLRNSIGYENDALNLRVNAEENTPKEKEDTSGGEALALAAFMKWVKDTINEVILNTPPLPRIKSGEHWTARFLDQATIQGFNQATGILFQKEIGAENVDSDRILDLPRIQTNLTGTTGRYFSAFSDLEDITDDMADEIERTLQEGIRNGWNPRRTADALTKRVRTIEKTRAVTLARTETVKAHTDAAIANYQRNGITTVGHVSRIVTPDNALCPFCRRLRDVPFTIREFQNVVVEWRGKTYRVGIPSHANGRCAPDPIVDMGSTELGSLEERLQSALGDHTVINR